MGGTFDCFGHESHPDFGGNPDTGVYTPNVSINPNSLSLWEATQTYPSPSGKQCKLIPLPLRSNANLSLSLWERLGEGIAQFVVYPPLPSSPSRERGCFLYEINLSPLGSNANLSISPLGSIANLSLSLWERLGEGKETSQCGVSTVYRWGKKPCHGHERRSPRAGPTMLKNVNPYKKKWNGEHISKKSSNFVENFALEK